MESNRLMKLLYYLTQSANPVTAKELAVYASVSERTVKNDMGKVQELAEQSGCTICARKGKGYWIEVTDQGAFKELEDQLYYRFSHTNYTREYEDRANRVVRMLLVEEDYVKLDEIADRLYLSRSSIKGIMQEVRGILTAFQLNLVTKPGYGVRVEGLELNIRFCMLELFIDHDYRTVPDIQENAYIAYFSLDQVEIGKLRHDFLDVLRRSGTRIVDNNTHRLVRYFYLLYNRFLKGYRLEFGEEDGCFLRGIREYDTAAEILKVLEREDTYIPVEETEIFGLELLLLLWNDLNEEDDLEGQYPFFYKKSDELTDVVLNRIRTQWEVDLGDISGIRPILISAMIPACVKIRFPLIGYDRIIGKKVENNMMSSSPLCIALALTVDEVIRECYGLKLSRADLFHYTVRFYICISRIRYDYVPRRILISAQSGNQSCVMIRDRLLKKFGREAFETIDMLNSYEIRGINQEEYDYLILNFAPYYYRYDLPVIYVDSIPDERQLSQVFYQVILGGFKLRSLQNQLQFSEDFVFSEFEYEGREAFFRLVSYQYCTSAQVRHLQEQLQVYTDICVWNGVASVIVNSRYTGRNQIGLYCLHTPGIWEKKTIQYILFCSVSFGGEQKLVKYVEQLTHELVSHPDQLELLEKTKSMNQFVEIIKHGLTLGQ